jgi:hypothetical protein
MCVGLDFGDEGHLFFNWTTSLWIDNTKTYKLSLKLYFYCPRIIADIKFIYLN